MKMCECVQPIIRQIPLTEKTIVSCVERNIMLKWEDMTGDGKTDILGQNKTRETLYILYMNGTTVTGGVSITGWETLAGRP
jgi:hypothetical protein